MGDWELCEKLPGPERDGCMIYLRKKMLAEATVWAHRVGDWVDGDHSAGWGYSTHVETLGELAQFMAKKKLEGRVSKLGIVAHGDAPGEVVLDRVLNGNSVDTFRSEFEQLGRFLRSDGFVTFYSCIAGRFPEGAALLAALSRMLPGRTFVAFSVWGYIGGLRNKPGIVQANNDAYVPPKDKLLGFLDPWCRWACRAKDGLIIHKSVYEQTRDPRRKCARPGCPGHAELGESCPGY